MKSYLLAGVGLLLALTLAPADPAVADAAVAERIRALSLRIEQYPVPYLHIPSLAPFHLCLSGYVSLPDSPPFFHGGNKAF